MSAVFGYFTEEHVVSNVVPGMAVIEGLQIHRL